MSTPQVPPRNRAERRLASKGKRARAAGAALTAGSAALAMGAAWIGTGAPGAAAATTLHVTTTADAGAGSLRDTVAGASAGDTIAFDVTGTITLTSGEIAINQPLTFSGPGATSLAISGNDASRIFNITGNAAVTISGLAFTHGSSPSGTFGGGAIHSDGPLTLDDDAFEANHANGGGGGGDDGGAVYADGPLNISNSSFTDNQADDWGGAILATSINSNAAAAVDVAGSTFSNNEATDGNGGGLSVEEESGVTISGSTFDGNAGDEGGGFSSDSSGPVTITGSTFTGNHSTDGSSGGGGIRVDGGDSASISSTTVSGNDSGNVGGGISLLGIGGAASLDGVTVTGNTAASGGGGVYASELPGGLAVSNSTISGNQSTGRWGGGLYASYTYQFVNVTNTTISNNSAAQGGGGVQLAGGGNEQTVSVIDSTISGNTANGSGGGGWIQWDVAGTTTFANTTISGNTAQGEGGGLYFYGSSLSVEMSTISGNTASDTTGGVYLAGGTEIDATQGGHGHGGGDVASTGGETDSQGNPVEPHVRRNGGSDVHAAAAIATADITGSIVSGNSANDVGGEGTVTFSHDIFATVASQIVQNNAGGNLIGADPLLGPLQNNGGSTETMALLAGSPAIDAGPNPVPDFDGNQFDQRGSGFARVVNGTSDIGAYEVQPELVPVTPIPEPLTITPKFTG
jgi:predicted outer membrane repeat protein